VTGRLHVFVAVLRKRIGIAFALLYAFLGLIFVHYTGIETDEAVFAGPLYSRPDLNYCVTVFGKQVPIMLFPYGGTLKTLIAPETSTQRSFCSPASGTPGRFHI
jgi:hypothetical protein